MNFLCQNCGLFVDGYMVHDHVWQVAGFKQDDMYCLSCLNKRLQETRQQPLDIEDFTEAAVNKAIFFSYEMGMKRVARFMKKQIEEMFQI